MAHYLLIESRDPFGSATVEHQYDLATHLARESNFCGLCVDERGANEAIMT